MNNRSGINRSAEPYRTLPDHAQIATMRPTYWAQFLSSSQYATPPAKVPPRLPRRTAMPPDMASGSFRCDTHGARIPTRAPHAYKSSSKPRKQGAENMFCCPHENILACSCVLGQHSLLPNIIAAIHVHTMDSTLWLWCKTSFAEKHTVIFFFIG